MTKTKNIFSYDTVIGQIFIAETDSKITNLYFKKPSDFKNFIFCETKIIKEAALQLNMYLKGKLKNFNLSLNPEVSAYTKKVLDELVKIPYGKTISYMDLAKKISNSAHARAVASANGRNPLPLFIPCHRVISANGAIGGYLGGIKIKKLLLELENAK